MCESVPIVRDPDAREPSNPLAAVAALAILMFETLAHYWTNTMEPTPKPRHSPIISRQSGPMPKRRLVSSVRERPQRPHLPIF